MCRHSHSLLRLFWFLVVLHISVISLYADVQVFIEISRNCVHVTHGADVDFASLLVHHLVGCYIWME